MNWLEKLEMQKSMMGRGVDYETSELIFRDFDIRMEQHNSNQNSGIKKFMYAFNNVLDMGIVEAVNREEAFKVLFNKYNNPQKGGGKIYLWNGCMWRINNITK